MKAPTKIHMEFGKEYDAFLSLGVDDPDTVKVTLWAVLILCYHYDNTCSYKEQGQIIALVMDGWTFENVYIAVMAQNEKPDYDNQAKN